MAGRVENGYSFGWYLYFRTCLRFNPLVSEAAADPDPVPEAEPEPEPEAEPEPEPEPEAEPEEVGRHQVHYISIISKLITPSNLLLV